MQDKILLFDFDGTIADTGDAAVRIYNQIAKENNYRLISKENLARVRSMSAMDNVKYLGVPLLKLPFLSKKARDEFKNQIPSLKAIPGVKESLKALKSKGYGLFVVSSNARDNILSFLELNGIGEFDDVFSVSALFGKHVKIRKLIKENSWDVLRVLYVGDEVRDIEAAKKAGVISVAVTWGYNTEDVIVDNSPDVIVRNPSELAAL